MFKMRRAIN